jgi:hypothetical protein
MAAFRNYGRRQLRAVGRARIACSQAWRRRGSHAARWRWRSPARTQPAAAMGRSQAYMRARAHGCACLARGRGVAGRSGRGGRAVHRLGGEEHAPGGEEGRDGAIRRGGG